MGFAREMLWAKLDVGMLGTYWRKVLSGSGGGTISGDIVSFNTKNASPLMSCLVEIQPVQSGSGDPSPTNVRPITGWTGCNVSVSGADTENPTVYSVSWQTEAGTVYGGTVDLVSGVLTVAYGSADIGDLNWARSTSYTNPVFHVAVPGRKPGSQQVFFPVYAVTTNSLNTMPDYTVRPHGTSSRLYIRDDRYATVDAFIAAMSGVTFVFELETPVTYQLSPQEVVTLAGLNYIWADCGPITVTW